METGERAEQNLSPEDLYRASPWPERKSKNFSFFKIIFQKKEAKPPEKAEKVPADTVRKPRIDAVYADVEKKEEKLSKKVLTSGAQVDIINKQSAMTQPISCYGSVGRARPW